MLKLLVTVLLFTKPRVWLQQVSVLSKHAACGASLLLTAAVANLWFACF